MGLRGQTKMKIILQGYNTCCQNEYGGVQKRIRKIHSNLLAEGIDTELFSEFNTSIKEADILHIFMLLPENYGLLKCAKENNVKVVISSIVNIGNGKNIDISRILLNKLPILTAQKAQFDMLRQADAVITETPIEKEYIVKHYKINRKKVRVIPNGIDLSEDCGKSNERDIIYHSIGGEKEYALVVGRFDPNKNQLNVIKALKDTEIPVVFIGGAHFECPRYYEECLKCGKGASNIYFLGWQPNDSKIMKSAYRNAKLLITPSFQETFGFTLLEGGVNGCNLAISNTLPILGFQVFDRCVTFDPGNIEDIKEKIRMAFDSKEDTILREKLIHTFSWKNVIGQHINLYKGLIKQ